MLLSTSIASSEHPQVCTPAFDGCQLRYTVCPPDASRSHQEAGGMFAGRKGFQWRKMYLRDPKLAHCSHEMICKYAIVWKQCQTRLKLKARVSTLYIQVEECLSVSCLSSRCRWGIESWKSAVPLENLRRAGVDACRSSRNTKANVSELSHRYAMRFLLCLNASL